MGSRYDPKCVLLETPFSRWKEDKIQLLKEDRPTPKLSILQEKKGPSQNENFGFSGIMVCILLMAMWQSLFTESVLLAMFNC